MHEEKYLIQLVLWKANSLLGRRNYRNQSLKGIQNWKASTIFSAEVTAGQNESSNDQEFTDLWQMQFLGQIVKKSSRKCVLVLCIFYKGKNPKHRGFASSLTLTCQYNTWELMGFVSGEPFFHCRDSSCNFLWFMTSERSSAGIIGIYSSL